MGLSVGRIDDCVWFDDDDGVRVCMRACRSAGHRGIGPTRLPRRSGGKAPRDQVVERAARSLRACHANQVE